MHPYSFTLLTCCSKSFSPHHTIFQPFVDSDHFIQQYFLPQEYAILIPVFAGVALLCFLTIFVGLVMLKSKKKKAWFICFCLSFLGCIRSFLEIIFNIWLRYLHVYIVFHTPDLDALFILSPRKRKIRT